MYVDGSITESELIDIYTQTYADAPFVTLATGLKTPSTKYVAGSNCCMISFKSIPTLNKIVVFSALDNLIKGASGQAIQCMNLGFGFEETLGLPLIAPYL